MKVKEENEKVGLKLNIQKTKILTSSSSTSWQIDGETVETMTVFIWGLPGGSDGEESACNVGDPDLIPGSGTSPREVNGYPLQYSGLANSMGLQGVGHY